jgi:hypothetical protein
LSSRKRERHCPEALEPPPRQRASTSAAVVLPLHEAGNAAVSRLLGGAPRRLLRRPVADAKGTVTAIEFTVGQEIPVGLAALAKSVAAGGVTDKELRKLRLKALKDETINDDERMFLAGLLDPGNAGQVSGASVKAGAKLTFPRGSIEAHLAHVKDLDRPTMDPTVRAEFEAGLEALMKGDVGGAFVHAEETAKAAERQIALLATRKWAKQAAATVAFGSERGVPTTSILAAMLAAGSDSTPGDMVMAGTVFAIAAAASHSLASDLEAGRIKVDQMPGKLLKRPGKKGTTAFATYFAMGSGASKGDTIYVPAALDIANVDHRAQVMHELQHALEDKTSAPATVTEITLADAELRGYRAGARYQLEEIARLSGAKRDGAVKQVAATLNPIALMALALESHRDRKRLEMIVVDVNAAAQSKTRLTTTKLAKLLSASDAAIEAQLLKFIRLVYEIDDKKGFAIPDANRAFIDSLSGESLLDWIDRA